MSEKSPPREKVAAKDPDAGEAEDGAYNMAGDVLVDACRALGRLVGVVLLSVRRWLSWLTARSLAPSTRPSDEDEPHYESTAVFKPVVQLDEVETKTHEEDEETLYKM